MKTVTNKTQKPISVPLPRGKTLHLGPGKTGQIASNAADHPPLKKLVEAGTLVVEDAHAAAGPGREGKLGGPLAAHAGGIARRGGDR